MNVMFEPLEALQAKLFICARRTSQKYHFNNHKTLIFTFSFELLAVLSFWGSPRACARACVDLYHINACLLKSCWDMEGDLSSVNFGLLSTKPFNYGPVNEPRPQRSGEVRCGG
jgi:hypothetical protein